MMTATDTQTIPEQKTPAVETHCEWFHEHIWHDLCAAREAYGYIPDFVSVDVTESAKAEMTLPTAIHGTFRFRSYRGKLAAFTWADKRAVAVYEVEGE